MIPIANKPDAHFRSPSRPANRRSPETDPPARQEGFGKLRGKGCMGNRDLLHSMKEGLTRGTVRIGG